MRLLIVGNGVLASMVTQLLCWSSEDFEEIEIIVSSRKEVNGRQLKNLAYLASLNLNRNIKIRHIQLDLDKIERTAEIFFKTEPDIIFNTATMQSYWVISELPEPIFRSLSLAGVGPWMPLHMVPVYKLMQAYRLSGIDGRVINSAFPDAVNPALKTLGYSPHIGIGNVANIIQPIRVAIAMKYKISVEEINVKLVCHHAISNAIPTYGSAKNAPYLLEARHESGRDLLEGVKDNEIFSLIKNELIRPRGKNGMWVTASSAVRVINAFMEEDEQSVHAPGPNGLIGGYPLVINNEGFRLDLPLGLTEEQAVEINKKGQRFDGIEEITFDKKLILMDASVDIMKSIIGYCEKVIDLHCIEEYASELIAYYAAFSNKWRNSNVA